MRHMTGTLRRRRAFTLVELLVVISILALLIAVLVPSLRSAKRVSRRVVCGTNLHAIGQGLRMYLNDSEDYLPVVAFLPSMEVDEEHPRPSLASVLLPYIRQNAEQAESLQEELDAEGEKVFHCPADLPGKVDRGEPHQGKTYFETENSSYVFNTFLYRFRDRDSLTGGEYAAPVKLSQVVRSERAKFFFGGTPAESSIWLMRDYTAFHGEPGAPGASNYLYVDGHVGDLEQ